MYPSEIQDVGEIRIGILFLCFSFHDRNKKGKSESRPILGICVLFFFFFCLAWMCIEGNIQNCTNRREKEVTIPRISSRNLENFCQNPTSVVTPFLLGEKRSRHAEHISSFQILFPRHCKVKKEIRNLENFGF